jgi:uncharacterized membrane protein YgaE (UPF0421/DUF939 family)
VCAGILGFCLNGLFQGADFPWFLVSVVLVLSPDSKEALPLALSRVKANAVGAAASFLCLLLLKGLPNAVTVCAALGLAVLLCHPFKARAGSRSALAAVIIILFHEPGQHLWQAAVERFLSVAAGCLAGLVVTVLFHRALGRGADPQAADD